MNSNGWGCPSTEFQRKEFFVRREVPFNIPTPKPAKDLRSCPDFLEASNELLSFFFVAGMLKQLFVGLHGAVYCFSPHVP